MILPEEVKNKIIEILDSKEFLENLYEGLPVEKRKEFGQVYTPALVCIEMLEKFSCSTLSGKTILDPACGSGNLLIACLIAGADSDKLFGNDYDATAVELCRKRINRVCEILGKNPISDWQIHRGNALQKMCITDFTQDYLNNYDVSEIDNIDYGQTSLEKRKEFKQINLCDGLINLPAEII